MAHDLKAYVQAWLFLEKQDGLTRNQIEERNRLETCVIDELKALDKIGSSDPCHVERQSVEHDLCCVFVTQDTDPANTKCINVGPDGRIEEYFP